VEIKRRTTVFFKWATKIERV